MSYSNFNNNRYQLDVKNTDFSNSKRESISNNSNVMNMNRKEDRIISLGPQIKNDIGENNCYLNVLIHLLFNIKELRSFILDEENKLDKRHHLIYELRNIMEHYSNIINNSSRNVEQLKSIDPKEFREELARLFKQEKKFQMYQMDDPVELLFVILNTFHSMKMNLESLKYISESPCDPQCLSHNLFWINIYEQYECQCQATSELLTYDYNYFFYETYVKEILNLTQHLNEINQYKNRFFNFLKFVSNKTENPCPGDVKCKISNVRKNLIILNSSPYLFFNLVWRETQPKLEDICKLFLMLPQKFKNRDLFLLYDDNLESTYELFGLVCFWGCHYISFYKSEDQNGNSFWVLFDDNNVTKINTWIELVIKCIKNHFHPTLLFYRKCQSDNNFNLFDKKDIKEEELLEKLIQECITNDKRNSDMYKKEENLSSRLRPNNFDIKSSKVLIDQEKLNKMKKIDKINENKNEMDIDDENKLNNNVNNNVKTSEYNTFKNLNHPVLIDSNKNIINQNYEYKNNTKNDYLLEQPVLAEDEWICEKTNCSNVNKNTNHTCLKCKKMNINIYDMIKCKEIYVNDKNAYPDFSNNNVKKREQNLQPNSRSYNLNNLNVSINSSKIKENDKNKNIKQSFNNIDTNLKIEKNLYNTGMSNFSNIGNVYLERDNNKSEKYSQISKINTNNLNSNLNNSITTSTNFAFKNWLCDYCKKLNSSTKDHCEKCFKTSKNNLATSVKLENNLNVKNTQNSFLKASNNYGTNPLYNNNSNNINHSRISTENNFLSRKVNAPVTVNKLNEISAKNTYTYKNTNSNVTSNNKSPNLILRNSSKSRSRSLSKK